MQEAILDYLITFQQDKRTLNKANTLLLLRNWKTTQETKEEIGSVPTKNYTMKLN